jgi:DNA-binding CsgD family transcriptional regulator/tetratricopeptide (TPR) repeat protein
MRNSSALPRINPTQAPLVARQPELERILASLEGVAAGRGQLVLLEGEPGVGKTRLAREVLARARTVGMHGYLGRCFDQYTAVPFFPFAELFAAILAEAPAALQAEAPARWPELAYIVPKLGPPRAPQSQETQLQVFRAAAGFVHAMATLNPLVLMLDDLHWADSTSLALLLYLGRQLHAARVLILGTYRTAEVARQPTLELTLRELVRERLTEAVELEPLSMAGTAALIRSRLPDESVSDQLVALVHDRAQGNPFFTEELLTALVDKGVVLPGGAGLRPAALVEFKLPRSIRSVVHERVGRLPPEAREVLTLASILGQEFPLDLLLAASDRPEAAVVNAVDAALAAGLLEERQPGHAERYGFVHALIQEALYEELPVHHRRRLHTRAGVVLEQLHAADDTVAAELAWHFLQAGDTNRGAAYAIQAGDHAAGRYAHAEAVREYAVALGVLRERGDRAAAADVQRRLASELFELNRLPEAVVEYESSLAAFQELADDAGQAMVHWGLGRLHNARYDLVQAVHHLDEALRLWPTQRDDAEFARLLVDAARARTFSGDADAAIQLAERGLALAERLDDAGLLARALLGVVTAHDQDTLDRPLIDMLNRAEDLARTVGDWSALSRIYSSRGVKRFHTGAVDEALADRRRSIAAAERSAETHRLAFAYQALANDCSWVGAWDEGRAAARAGLALDPQGQVGAYTAQVDLAWMEGRREDAVRQVRAMLSDARARRDVQGVTDGLSQLADFAVQLGRPAEAEAPAREAAELARSSWRSELGGCLAILSETLAWLDAPDAEAVVDDAGRSIDELGKDADRPQPLRAKGLLRLRRGDIAGAIVALDASAAAARSQHMLIQLGRTLTLLADAARQGGDAALAARADAERAAIVERIGPEVRGLAWTLGLAGARRQRARAPTDDGQSAAPLSPRARQVAALIARGLTDRQIAAGLVITEGTAGVHVSHILNKLGFHARSEIASWAVRHGLDGTSDA